MPHQNINQEGNDAVEAWVDLMGNKGGSSLKLKEGQLAAANKNGFASSARRAVEIIHCACKKDCNTNRCSCRRHGLSCSPACIGCNGVTCLNCTLQDDVGECSDT